VHIEGALKDGPGARKLLLLELPLGVLEPVCEADAVAADVVLELAALAALVFLQLLEVGKALGRLLDGRLLSVDGFAEQLLGRDLHRRRRLVLDPRRAARGLHGAGCLVVRPGLLRASEMSGMAVGGFALNWISNLVADAMPQTMVAPQDGTWKSDVGPCASRSRPPPEAPSRCKLDPHFKDRIHRGPHVASSTCLPFRDFFNNASSPNTQLNRNPCRKRETWIYRRHVDTRGRAPPRL
jgi:hypothetical protein